MYVARLVFAPVRQTPFLHGIIHAYVVMRTKDSTVKSLTVAMSAGTLVKMVQYAKILWMVLPIALTAVVYLDMRVPFVKRTLMNASPIHA